MKNIKHDSIKIKNKEQAPLNIEENVSDYN